jgi:CcmD family protein
MTLSTAMTGIATMAGLQSSGDSTGENANSAPSAPSDRSTTFQPTEGGTETRSGQTLMVEAYAVIWTILMVWLVVLWRKQASLNQRLDGLESAIVKASSRAATEAEPAAAKAAASKLGGQPSS